MGATLMLLYSLTIFLSAFLLFQVQPIIAKMILPWFGGTSAVWSTCMLFFQMVLLLGYVYAHWLNRTARSAAAGGGAHRCSDDQPCGAPDPAERFLEEHRGRAAVPANPGAARGDCGAAVFPALFHQPAVAGMVCAEPQGRPALPAVRAFEFRVAAGAAQLSAGDRAEPAGALAGIHLVRCLCGIRGGLRADGVAKLARSRHRRGAGCGRTRRTNRRRRGCCA